MMPLVKILSSRSTAELTLEVNAYLSQMQALNNNGSLYSLHSVQFKVTPLADLGIMYSVLLVFNDAAAEDTGEMELPF